VKLDVVIAGVGGQGNVLAARIIARAGMEAGFSVRTAEVTGMAQREGAVVSHVRIGDALRSALIPGGEAELLLAFEPAEAVRSLARLKGAGTAVVDPAPVVPVTVGLGLSAYDVDACLRFLKERVSRLFLLEASRLALAAGSPKAANAVFLGAVSSLGILPFAPEALFRQLLDAVPERYREVNRKAFFLGKEAAEAGGRR
jgi:indolepyruvate ferredoxin oxidoreductase beta subunit